MTVTVNYLIKLIQLVIAVQDIITIQFCGSFAKWQLDISAGQVWLIYHHLSSK
jgi:hypothetical protein